MVMVNSNGITVEPYHYIPVSECGKITRTKTTEVKLDESGRVVEKKETHVEASGTSIKESVQDIVMDGGQHVVKDVVLTINQAMGPVEKGVTKIQEKLLIRMYAYDMWRPRTGST
ncbi:hypothetical protein Bca52824_076796 [Brassica carinata]|uniref:Uncharacterized protein n=1 Tax=Brassica carinata TaxID=52824 RepID=A0A8X7PVK8_BRACI|nr:hypothetical protein Bca52824_076796 [Brassica carinata]